MGKVKIVHNNKAFAELLRNKVFVSDLLRRAEAIASAAGGESVGIKAVAEPNPRVRARAAVISLGGDPENRIIRNLDAGR